MDCKKRNDKPGNTYNEAIYKQLGDTGSCGSTTLVTTATHCRPFSTRLCFTFNPTTHTMGNFQPDFTKFFIVFIPALIGIILHEVAHGAAAYMQGDPTAKQLGRLSLNPIRHLDPTGTLVFIATALFSPIVFGWAKPVPIQSQYFRHPRQGLMLVSVAGPLANFFVALLCGILFVLLYKYGGAHLGTPASAQDYILQSALAGITINCVLGWFNLMPIPPLDGGHIICGLLPRQLAYAYSRIGRYGMLILLGLLYFNLLSPILWPLVIASRDFIITAASWLC